MSDTSVSSIIQLDSKINKAMISTTTTTGTSLSDQPQNKNKNCRIYSSGAGSTVYQSLPPEIEEGNIEYKLKLVNPTQCRVEHLITQMKWRLREGDGEAIYEIGVEDNGIMSGLLKDELDSSVSTLQYMATRLDAETLIVRESTIEFHDGDDNENRYAVEVLVRKIPNNQEFIDIRVACLGNVDVGKSTLLGVLGSGDLDNGRGRARLNMFRHLHEIQTGRTSSISTEILAFDTKGEVLNYGDSTAEEICATASKLITFLDLAGHHKYIKTTILGLTGHSPEVVMLIVAANRGLVGTTKEHLGLAVALKIPFLIVVNKIDLCNQATVDRTVMQLEKILKSTGCNKVPIVVNDEDDAATAASNFSSKQVTPIFKVSSVTGKNLPLLRSFYNLLPSLRTKIEIDQLIQQPAEFGVDEVFTIQNVGPVLAGTLRNGVIREGDSLVLGPTEDGTFTPVTVTSIHRNRTPCRIIQAGQAACIAASVTDCDFAFRRGQVLLEASDDVTTSPLTCLEFEADIFLLFHATQMCRKFQTTVHINNVLQTAVVKWMSKDKLKTGQRAKVLFKFIGHPEYIQTGDRIFIREGRSKGIGEITKIYPYDSKQRNSSSDSDST